VGERNLPFVQGWETKWEWQVEGGVMGGVRAVTVKSGPSLALRLWGYASPLLAWIAATLLLAGVAAWWTDCRWIATTLLLTAAAGLGLAVEQMGAAMAAVWPLVKDTAWHPSPWDRFKPNPVGKLDAAPGANLEDRRQTVAALSEWGV
jgi:hypothetical protein